MIKINTIIKEIRRNRNIEYHSHIHLDSVEKELKGLKELLQVAGEVIRHGREDSIKKEVLDRIEFYIKD